MSSMTKQEYELELTKRIGGFFNDPVGYFRFAFKDVELDTWQDELLTDISTRFKEDPEETLRYAVSSGH